MKILHDVPLSSITYYQIGGTASLVLDVSSVDDVKEAITYINSHKIKPVRVIGLGANVLLPDEPITGAVIHLHSGINNFTQSIGGKITAFAGASMEELIQFSFINKMVGLGWAGGLPSTVGGAVRGNAGCFGSEIKDIVTSVEAIDLTSDTVNIRNFTQAACNFNYRDSIFKHQSQYLIVSVTITLNATTEDEIEAERFIYERNKQYRQLHHPLEYPSCGSVYKNISRADDVAKIIKIWPDIAAMVKEKWYGKVSMAYIIGRLGFSGYKVGGAQVSEKHNNYISNVDHAKAADVKAIINTISDKFNQTFGFPPDLEVQI